MNPNPSTSTELNMTLERLQGLYELIACMNSESDLQELLEFVVDKVLNLTGGKRGLLLLSDDHNRALQHVAVIRGEPEDPQDLDKTLDFVSTTVIKDVLKRGEPRIVADLRSDQRYEGLTSETTLQFKKVRSVMAVPLKVSQQLVGLIYIDHPKQSTFKQADLDFLSAFASQAALVINRSREYQRQIEDLTRLNDLSQSVVQVLDLDEVLARIINEANRMLNVENGSVLLLDEAGHELSFAISISNGERVNITSHLQKDQGIAGWVVSHGEPACVNDVSQDPRWFGEVETGFVTRSLLCVPLRHNRRILGVLEALNKKSPDGFTPRDIALLSAFANSATIAIENARLFQEARQARQLRALNEMALTLSSTLELGTILNTGLDQTLAVLGADAGAISLSDDQTSAEAPIVQISRGLSQNPDLLQQQEEAIEQLSAWVINRGSNEACLIEGAQAEPNFPGYPLFTSGFKTLVCMPMKVGQAINGALTIMKASDHTHTPEEINLLTGLARIIGLAVQNATHHSQVRAQTVHLSYLNEIGGALTRSLDLEHVLKVIIEGVNALMKTERTSVFLIDPDTNDLVLRYTNEGDANIRLSPPWQGIAGWVATHDRPALVNNTLSDPRHLRQVAAEIGYEAHSILCVPIKIEGQVIGVVQVLNKTGAQQFTHQHQAMLMEFTKWAAIALHNARLFNERVQAYQRLTDEQNRRIAAETRGAMAAIILDMAHTMNNVVGAIRVWSSKLDYTARTKPQTPLSQFTKEINRIRENAQEAIKLIGDMTDPLEQPDITPTDVHQCLVKAVKSCWWPENIQLRQDYGQNIPLVGANARRLEAVFHNLLSNAIQVLTDQGGEICIRTRPNADGNLEVIIIDNGPGIPPELQEHIFKPTISGKDGGLGLGLWLVETFIHQFDGEITFTSSAETGTTFVVTLQASEERKVT